MDLVTDPPGTTTVELLPFGLLYEIDQSEVPEEEDFEAAAEIIIMYIDDYFSMLVGDGAESQYESGTFAASDTAWSLNGAFSNFDGSVTFSDTGSAPAQAELDAALDEAFSGENVQVVLDLLGKPRNQQIGLVLFSGLQLHAS
jgi:hypothetical protein